MFLFCFFFNDTPTTEIYTLSLHDALPISRPISLIVGRAPSCHPGRLWPVIRWRSNRLRSPATERTPTLERDRKSTRLNSSHMSISYAVFCLKKKKKKKRHKTYT